MNTKLLKEIKENYNKYQQSLFLDFIFNLYEKDKLTTDEYYKIVWYFNPPVEEDF